MPTLNLIELLMMQIQITDANIEALAMDFKGDMYFQRYLQK